MDRRLGYAMAGIGFLMLVANAISYVFDVDAGHPVNTILGLVFVIIGLRATKTK